MNNNKKRNILNWINSGHQRKLDKDVYTLFYFCVSYYIVCVLLCLWTGSVFGNKALSDL